MLSRLQPSTTSRLVFGIIYLDSENRTGYADLVMQNVRYMMRLSISLHPIILNFDNNLACMHVC